jgi:selenide,water dikinase
MGGRPLTALAIAGFPKKGVDHRVIGAVFRGGYEKLVEAGVALLGGHTVQDPEIKFGYAVTGAIDPKRILSNSNARVGDRIFLTKPLGTGVIGTALKNRHISEADAQPAIASMRTLNKLAAETMLKFDAVHSCTDVTGFGLIGHASEVATASGVTIQFDVARVPLLPHARALLSRNRAGGMNTNREYFGSGVQAASGLEEDLVSLLYDPQTSGGLLIFVGAEQGDALHAALLAAGVPAVEIGRSLQPSGNWIALC